MIRTDSQVPRRKASHSKAKRRSAIVLAVAMLGAMLFQGVGVSGASTTATVTPSASTNLISGQVITVDVGNINAIPSAFLAVTLCGNADTAGVAFTAAPVADDCVGSEGGFSATGAAGIAFVSSTGVGSSALAGSLDAATTYTATLTLKKTGLGLNNSQCLPYNGTTVPVPCTIAVSPATLGGAYSDSAYPATTYISYKPAATFTVDSVDTQTGTSAARRGDTINVSGSNWDASTTLTAELCLASDHTSCDATSFASGSATTDGSGVASGALVVDAGATAGARVLKISDSDESYTAAIQILGTRAIVLTPTVGGLGTSVSITGSNFDASKTVAISELDATFTQVGTPSSGTTTSTGGLTDTQIISDTGTAYIAVVELDGSFAPIVATATFAAFAFSADSCVGTGCELVQTVSMTVTGSTLSVAQSGNAVTMSAITLDGDEQTATGGLNDFDLVDARGSLVGWTVTVTMSDLQLATSVSNNSIAASEFTMTPTCVLKTATSGDLTERVVGSAAALDNTVGVPMCTAAAGGGGGTFVIDGGLSVTVPATLRSGSFSATLTILIV